MLSTKEQPTRREVHMKLEGKSKRWRGSIPDPKDIYEDGHATTSLSKEKLQEFLRAKEIVFWNFMGAGIGDMIMGLRYARCVAEHLPKKKCIAFVHPALLGLKHMTLPSNCRLIPRSEGFNTNKYSETPNIHLSLSSEILSDKKLFAGSEGVYDIMCLRILHAYGVDLTLPEIQRSLLSLSKEEVQAAPHEYAYLFVPDAKEVSTLQGDRSMKSLSLEQYEAIFSHMPNGANIGIVMGTSHPGYTEAVYALAKSIALDEGGFTVSRVQTQTLDDLIGEILKTDTFVGMDSGTTHLAYEVALAAKEHGKTLHIKEVFNSALFKIAQYGLRGGGEDIEVLQGPLYTPKKEDHASCDVQFIPSKDLTDFIFGEVQKMRSSPKRGKRS